MMQARSMLAPIALAFALFACSRGSTTSGPPSATDSQAETTPPPTSVVPETAPADASDPDPGKILTGGSPDRTRFRFDLNVGVAWVGRDNNICMTLKNAAADVGQRVGLATPNWPGTHKVPGLVVAEVKDVKSESCKADEPDPDPDDVFYGLSAVTGEVHRDDGVFVAVLDPPPIMFVGESGVTGDLDGNGMSELFFSCSSNEGFHYSVWSGKREPGTRLWHHYRYIGMEIEANCDDLDYEDLPT